MMTDTLLLLRKMFGPQHRLPRSKLSPSLASTFFFGVVYVSEPSKGVAAHTPFAKSGVWWVGGGGKEKLCVYVVFALDGGTAPVQTRGICGGGNDRRTEGRWLRAGERERRGKTKKLVFVWGGGGRRVVGG